MDEEYADIYYVDTRNAVTRDHRPQQGRSPLPWVPRPRQPVSPTRTVYVPPAAQQAYGQPMYQQPIYQQPQPMIYTGPQPTGMGALFGRLTTGQIIEMIAQGFAALQSLPAAPVSTRELETDVANLVLYQGAIASHAKRDEQVRTLGSLVSKLVG